MGTVGDDEALGILGSPSNELRAVADLGPEDLGLLLFHCNPRAPSPPSQAPGSGTIPVGASVVGSEAAVPRNWSDSTFSPVDVCLGPSPGMPPAGIISGGPCRGLSGLEPANNQLPKGFYDHPSTPLPPGKRPSGDRICVSPNV